MEKRRKASVIMMPDKNILLCVATALQADSSGSQIASAWHIGEGQSYCVEFTRQRTVNDPERVSDLLLRSSTLPYTYHV